MNIGPLFATLLWLALLVGILALINRRTASLACLLIALLTIAIGRDGLAQVLLLVSAALGGAMLVLDGAGRLAGWTTRRRTSR